MTSEQGSKKNLVLDLVLICAIITCGYLAYVSYYDNQEITINRAYQHDMLITGNRYVMVFNFTSDVFSAQNDIKVTIVGFPESNADAKALFVYLPDSTIKGVSEYINGIRYDDPIFLHRDSEGVYRSDIETIQYLQEGSKCYYAFELLVDRTPSGCQDGAPEVIYISSPDSLYQFKNNKITLSLAYVFLAFTIMMVRDFIQGVGQNIMRLIKSRKNKTKNPEPK